MKNLLLILILFIPMVGFAQNEDKYLIDGNDIIVSKVVEDIDASADEIYGRVKNFFTRRYVSVSSVIKVDDKEGGLLIGEGLYNEIAYFNMKFGRFKANHILRVDIKDGRVRIICNVSKMITYTYEKPITGEYNIVDYYPITDKKFRAISKRATENAFKALVEKMNSSVQDLEKAIREGGVLNIEQEDW